MSVLIDTLIVLSRGTPGLVVAALVMFFMLLALIRRETGLMMIAALLIIPFAYTMGAWGGSLLFVRLLPIFPLLSAFAISRDETLLAWIFPFFPFIYLVYVVFIFIASDFRG
jgi:hypothetical protein